MSFSISKLKEMEGVSFFEHSLSDLAKDPSSLIETRVGHNTHTKDGVINIVTIWKYSIKEALSIAFKSSMTHDDERISVDIAAKILILIHKDLILESIPDRCESIANSLKDLTTAINEDKESGSNTCQHTLKSFKRNPPTSLQVRLFICTYNEESLESEYVVYVDLFKGLISIKERGLDDVVNVDANRWDVRNEILMVFKSNLMKHIE